MHAPPEPDLTRLAEAFRAQRERSGMTFDELAAASGLARQTLFNISAGRFYGEVQTWAILARTWGVALDDLIAPIWDKPDAAASARDDPAQDRRS